MVMSEKFKFALNALLLYECLTGRLTAVPAPQASWQTNEMIISVSSGTTAVFRASPSYDPPQVTLLLDGHLIGRHCWQMLKPSATSDTQHIVRSTTTNT